MDQRSKPYYFSFDTKTKPGKIIAHCVRFETQEFDLSPDKGFDQTVFTIFGADLDKDPRQMELVKCIRDSSY